MPDAVLIIGKSFSSSKEFEDNSNSWKQNSLLFNFMTSFNPNWPLHHIICWMHFLYVKHCCYSGFLPSPLLALPCFLKVILSPYQTLTISICLWCQFPWSANPIANNLLDVSTKRFLWHLKLMFRIDLISFIIFSSDLSLLSTYTNFLSW